DLDSHRVLYDAAKDEGFERIDLSKSFDTGMGDYRMSKSGVLRQSSSVVFLHPLEALPANLAVLTETAAQRLIFAPDGSVSGVAPAQELQKSGIQVRRDLPGVGAHLLDHPAACVNIAASRKLARDELWNYAGVLFTRIEPDAPWPDIEIQLGPELFEQQTAPA